LSDGSRRPILLSMTILISLAFLGALGALGVLADRYGVDTRPGFDERDRI
jgi:hypothetical protein